MHSPFINTQIDRILAIGILLAGLGAGYGFIQYVYLEQLHNFNYEIELKKKRNARVDSILASENDLRSKIRQQKNINKKNKIFLNSKKPATAASELQNYLKQLISRQSKAKILAIKPYPVTKFDDYSETSLEIRIKDIDHKDLHKVLFMIENRKPVLLIKELDIKLGQLNLKSFVKSSGAAARLSVTMVVSGFYRELSGESQL